MSEASPALLIFKDDFFYITAPVRADLGSRQPAANPRNSFDGIRKIPPNVLEALTVTFSNAGG